MVTAVVLEQRLCSTHAVLIIVLFLPVENNCGYHLFESDSEEEEDEVVENKEEEKPPKKKSAFQVRTPETQMKKEVLDMFKDMSILMKSKH